MTEFFTLPESPQLPVQARVWVAYSGGLDSTVLLHALANQRVPGLHAVHIHHGLQVLADEWVQHCQAQCATLGVSLRILHVHVDGTHAAGPEAAAREARYEALRGVMQADDLLVTAHHQNDQAETVLLRLLRGTGVHGLSAMRPLLPFAPGQLWRPLLEVPRAELFRYAQWHRLSWIEDPHNQSPRYARSWLRSEIMPRLSERWPSAQAQLAQAAAHSAEAADLLDELAQSDLQRAVVSDADERVLNISALMQLSLTRRSNLLRYWLRHCGWPVPSAQMLTRLQTEVLDARTDAQPLLNCGAYEFRRYREHLHVMTPLAEPPVEWSCAWDGQGNCVLPADCGVLQSRECVPQSQPLTVRFAHGGERIQLHPEAHSRTLKNLFQEAAVPPWIRPRLPLLYAGEQLLCVACRWWAVDAPKPLKEIRWQHALPGWNHEQEEQEQ